MATTADILVEPEEGRAENLFKYSKRDTLLVSWVMEHVDSWEDHRDTNFLSKWDEYERLWSGKWIQADKTRKSERSKLINPALQQAIEATIAELEESTFGKGKFWFDLEDDVLDEDKDDMMFIRNILLEDLNAAKVPTEIAKVFFYGALFGTGIGKILVNKIVKKEIQGEEVSSVLGVAVEPKVVEKEEVEVSLEAIDPRNFAIDPAARSIDEALGCAYVIAKPKHMITKKQEDGTYNTGDLGDYDDVADLLNNDEGTDSATDYTKIVEYHGLVPTALLIRNLDDDDLEELEDGEEAVIDEDDLTEAIVTIANDSLLLRAIKNPHLMQDRGFISYQHDLVPNSFWGRGVAEKGYNPQKALDAELRARIDVMALVAHPMMAADSTKLPRGQTLAVRPGKLFLTTGDPSQVFYPFKFGNLDPASFASSSDLERMVQVGTGAVDTASPTSMNGRNSTASGMSMMTASTLKRQKRAKQNIDNCFLLPLIQRSLWRHMQYNPDRYPVKDFKFCIKATMGIMAREYEQAQMTNLLSVIPQDSPMFSIIIKGIVENSSLESKGEMLKAIEQWATPDPKQQQEEQQRKQMMEQLQMENAQLTNLKLKSEAVENFAQAGQAERKTQNESFNADTNRITAVTNALKDKGNRPNENERS